MAKITATVSYVELEGDYGPVDGVEVTCSSCGHSEESYGTSEASLKRCARLLHENCPRRENNFYEIED